MLSASGLISLYNKEKTEGVPGPSPNPPLLCQQNVKKSLVQIRLKAGIVISDGRVMYKNVPL